MSDITWRNDTRRLGDLIPWEHNPKVLSEREGEALRVSLDKFGLALPLLISPSNEIYDGHQRRALMERMSEYGPGAVVDVRVSSRELTWDERRELVVRLRENQADWNWESIANIYDPIELADWGMAEWKLEEFMSADDDTNEGTDAEPQIDRAEELREKWGVLSGQLWRLGEHRLLCGDCTDPAVVERVMGGEKAILCHADPPYGMGKEKDGIANDNLYREKLDAFQMQWWGAARKHLEDNSSVYIWGNAEDLWRLWYIGGLRDSERLTFRNEIIWEKGFAQQFEMMDKGNSILRSYNLITERCLFFMLGEQGFNNNADNYWEGWEPIRSYLEQERKKAGWDVPAMKRAVGHSELSGDHWTGKSQWNFPSEEVYKKLQAAARGVAFKREYDDLKREYDDLKREFYATRAYFDNTHDNMTDVWNFGRVAGEERWGHATPKPVPMIERIVKTSTPENAIVLDPFLGSGTTLIACENLNRRCRAIEIDSGYVAVALQRYFDATGDRPELIDAAPEAVA